MTLHCIQRAWLQARIKTPCQRILSHLATQNFYLTLGRHRLVCIVCIDKIMLVIQEVLGCSKCPDPLTASIISSTPPNHGFSHLSPRRRASKLSVCCYAVQLMAKPVNTTPAKKASQHDHPTHCTARRTMVPVGTSCALHHPSHEPKRSSCYSTWHYAKLLLDVAR